MKNSQYLKDKVVLITGGSKGLGLVLARHLVREKCLLALCARSEQDLNKAKAQLEKLGGTVIVKACDVGNEEHVKTLVTRVIQHYGHLDMVINVAGIMQVGPMETFTHKDYKKAMDVMYWGIANTTKAVLTHMKERKSGHIVNITSVGGMVAVPHLLPYDASKFAAVGFSEGSAAELMKDKITVTTIVPWLMRTGSYVNAFFQRGNKKEFKLFSLLTSLPVLTLDPDRAAKKIIMAIKQKKNFKVIGRQAKVVIEFHHFFPNLTTRIFGMVSGLIPVIDQEAPLERGREFTLTDEDAEIQAVRHFGKKARDEHQDLRT